MWLGVTPEQPFTGIDIGTPEPQNRKTAYFRHRFRTDRDHRDLSLMCYRDDSLIVYLDGVEVARHNMEEGPESYSLSAELTVGGKWDRHHPISEPELATIPLSGTLPPGEHVLAISLHNHIKDDRPSSDLRLGGIRLLSGLPAEEEED